TPRQAPFPMVLPLFSSQAASPPQAPFATVARLSVQAVRPTHAAFPIVVPVLFSQASAPTQAVFPVSPLLGGQAAAPMQALFLTLPVLPRQANTGEQEFFPTVCASAAVGSKSTKSSRNRKRRIAASRNPFEQSEPR